MSRAVNGSSFLKSQPAAVYNSLSAMTLCSWIKTAAVATYTGVLVKDPLNTYDNFLGVSSIAQDSGINSSFTPDFFGSDAVSESSTPIGNAVWTHIAVTFDYATGSAAKLYINGNETAYLSQNGIAGGSPIDDSGDGWYIGSDTFSGMTGEVSDVRIYNAVLTAGNIASIFAGGSPASGNLVAWWKLCNADPFADSSGHGNVLTNVGSTQGLSEPPVSVCGSTAFSYTDSRNYGTFPNDSRDVQGTLTYDVPSEYSLKHWFDTSFNPTEPLPLDSRAAGAPEDSRVAAIIPENSRADF